MAQSNSSTPVKKRSEMELEDFEGFVHSVSPPKRSKKNQTPYFNMVIQTDRNDFHNAVFFTSDTSDNVRTQLIKASEKKKAIKLKKAAKAISFANPSSFDITCNSSTGILPIEDVKFSHKEPPITATLTIEKVKVACTKEIVSIDGKVTKVFPAQAKTSKDGKPLLLQQIYISDATGSLELSMWGPSQIFELDKCYCFQDVSVKEFNGIKSVVYMQTSSNKLIEQIRNVSTCTPESSCSHDVTDKISSVNASIAYKCASCGHELVPTGAKFIKCISCQMKQRTTSLLKTIQTRVKLSECFKKYTVTNKALSDFLQKNDVDIKKFDSDDIEEFLLNIEDNLMFSIINNNIIEKIQKITDSMKVHVD